jgi:hypothetical protein
LGIAGGREGFTQSDLWLGIEKKWLASFIDVLSRQLLNCVLSGLKLPKIS